MPANVKVLQFISHNGGGKPINKAKEHVKYMEANRETHRNNPHLFNHEKDIKDRREVFRDIETQPKTGVVLHKMVITLSEDERDRFNIDMRELARDTIASFETKNNMRLDWVGAVHDDKGHPHVHIAIRGRDQDGRQVGIYPKHVQQLRGIADREKDRQSGRYLGRDRDYIRELEKERRPERERQPDRQKESKSGGRSAANDMLSNLTRLIRQQQREYEHAQREETKDRGIDR